MLTDRVKVYHPQSHLKTARSYKKITQKLISDYLAVIIHTLIIASYFERKSNFETFFSDITSTILLLVRAKHKILEPHLTLLGSYFGFCKNKNDRVLYTLIFATLFFTVLI